MGILTLLAFTCLAVAAPNRADQKADQHTQPSLNAESVYALLDLIDAIAENNPGYEETVSALESLDEAARRDRVDELAARNASNASIGRKIDAFLGTEARRIYFRRFGNVTPDHFRQVFLALPYARVDAPGAIGEPYMELISARADVRQMVDRFVATVDLDSCAKDASRWLPERPYAVPEIYLVYDNNAGSYTAEGKAFYNLYGGERSNSPDSTGGRAIIAHELHHVFATPYLRFSRRQHDRWEHDRIDMIVREMVSEGAAIHCNPPRGFKKELWEDRQTVAALVGEFNRECRALDAGEVDEGGFRAWFSSTFHEFPAEILIGYASRKFGEDAERIAEANMVQRPDLVHALGWWMVSRISREGQKPEAVAALVVAPYTLLARYNDAIGPDDPELAVDARLIALMGPGGDERR